jgi:hypothetical protein
LLAGRPLRADRPFHFYRKDGAMPEAVELRLTIPAELGPEAEVLAELRHRVAATEAEMAAARQRTGSRVQGRRAVLHQAWWARPASFEPRRNLRPRVAARSKWPRIEALQRNQDFVADYIAAREAWRAGARVAFPVGTYWLRRHARVSIAEDRNDTGCRKSNEPRWGISPTRARGRARRMGCAGRLAASEPDRIRRAAGQDTRLPRRLA